MTAPPASPATSTLLPTRLRCAHLVNPLGVTPDRVRLSWQLQGSGPARAQSAYQLEVTAVDPYRDHGGHPVWDSGRVEHTVSADVEYAGSPLARGGRYSWRVRIWDENQAVSPWSGPARFEVELDPGTGWRGDWIGLGRVREELRPPSGPGPDDRVTRSMTPVPCLRRTFTAAKPVVSARLYVTALGLYEARLNGEKVGDAFLAPGWTDYRKRISYQTFDVTELLRQGENVLGALIADGWYSGFVGFDAGEAPTTAPHLSC